MGNRTPLFDCHQSAGARIVDFAGWDMPLNYGSQIEEHHSVRRHAGVFDVSHMLAIDVTGAGSRQFLASLLANDVAKLREPGQALYSCMLNRAGGVIDDLIVYRFGVAEFRLVVNAGTADKDLDWMTRQALEVPGVDLKPRRELALIAVQGPAARGLVWQAQPAWQAVSADLQPFRAAWVADDCVIARTGYTGEDGFELMVSARAATAVWASLLAVGVRPAGLGARDTLRLEAGMNLYGQDMDESVSPLESGLAWTVDSKTSRDFIGRSALAGAQVSRQMVGLVLLDRGVLRSHQRVITALGDGLTTSGSFSPTLGYSIALARVPVGLQPGDRVEVEVRGKALAARVVKPPFVRHGKALV